MVRSHTETSDSMKLGPDVGGAIVLFIPKSAWLSRACVSITIAIQAAAGSLSNQRAESLLGGKETRQWGACRLESSNHQILDPSSFVCPVSWGW